MKQTLAPLNLHNTDIDLGDIHALIDLRRAHRAARRVRRRECWRRVFFALLAVATLGAALMPAVAAWSGLAVFALYFYAVGAMAAAAVVIGLALRFTGRSL